MENENQTIFTHFVLLGLFNRLDLQLGLCGIFLIIYLITLLGNILMIFLILRNAVLHKPMYFFLCNLSFLDMSYSSMSIPKMLMSSLTDNKVIYFWGCVTQVFCFSLLISTECLLLSAMAYDRFVAICKPLLYHAIINNHMCVCLASFSWVTGLINAMTHTIFTFKLSFCRNEINHFLCEIAPLLKLSCTSTFLNEILLFALAGTISFSSFIFIFVSYINIISTILKIRSSEGRKKTFSTCASHLTVVAMLYGSAVFIYMRPSNEYSLNKDKFISVIYTVITPMLNPIIYSLRNADVKRAVMKTFLK